MELDAAKEGNLFEFTRPTFELLHSRGVSTGVITRNISAAVRIVFPDIDDLAQAFIPREIATKVKPDPGHLLQALECIGADPAKSLMVGDHPMDIEMARAAGTFSAAVTSGAMNAEAFELLMPDFLVEDVGTLMEQLNKDGFL